MLGVLAHGKALHISQPKNVAQSRRNLWLQTSHREPAVVLRFIVVIKRTTIEHRAFGLLLLSTRQISGAGHAVKRKSGVCHADVYKLPLSGLLAMDHRRQYAHYRMMGAPCNVGNLDAHGWRASFFTAAVAAHARKGEVIYVVPGAIFVGTGLAITCDGAVNQLRVNRLQGFVTNTQPVHYTRAELLNHNVIVLNQLQNLFFAAFFFQVQCKGLFASIQKSMGGTYSSIVGRHHAG